MRQKGNFRDRGRTHRTESGRNHKQDEKLTLRMGKKYFTSEATEKKIISKIYKQLMQLNIKKKKTQSKHRCKT